MADLNQMRESKGYNNYKSVDVALRFVGSSLENYTEQQLDSVHQKISIKLAHLPQCVKQCSQQIQDHNKWCATCLSWKNELKNFFKTNERPKWIFMESWNWPVSGKHIAEVFLPANWSKSGSVNLNDFSTHFNIWKRCAEVPSSFGKTAEPINKIRTKLAHGSATVDDRDVKDYFKRLYSFVNGVHIKPVIKHHSKLLTDLKDLEENSMNKNIEKALMEISTKVESLDSKISNSLYYTTYTSFMNKIIWIRMTLLSIVATYTSSMKTLGWKKIFMLSLVVAFIAMAIALATQFYPSHRDEVEKSAKDEGCLSERDHSVFSGNVEMLKYLPSITSFVGRQWLFRTLDKILFRTEIRQHGVMMLAGMGYGKSAIVAKLICSTNLDESYSIRKRLIAYHVCRFDARITKRPHIFIRRIVSMLLNHNAEFSKLVEGNDTACIRHFNEEYCEQDPNGCFDQCLRFPLNKLIVKEEDSKVIIIDGLDECEDNTNKENYLADLLKYRIHTFPSWIRFLVTCRDMLRCQQFKSHLEILRLNSNDTENRKDIAEFSRIYGTRVQSDNAQESNTPSFLLATSLLSSVNLNIIPDTLEEFYEEQFQRYFNMHLTSAGTILEIIVSSLEVITYSDLWYIVSNTTDIEYDTYEYIMESLKQFFRPDEDKIYLCHVSLKTWLLSSNNSKFRFRSSHGHHLHAKYLRSLLEKMNQNIDVVELVVHASLSSKYSNDLLYFDNANTKQLVNADREKHEYPLHRLARWFDNSIATKHLLKHFPEVDKINKENRTAAFIAASAGHADTLHELVRQGANITFRTESFYDIINLDSAAQISFKLQHWDYGILDIAAQNGHLKIVKFIVDNANISNYPLKKKNGMNLLPVHLACKLGHRGIVEYLYTSGSNRIDRVCLYYASESGNTNLISYLLRLGIQDECKPCGPELYWLPEGKTRIQGEKLIAGLKQEYRGSYVLFDDWHYLTCETALHVAVRQNHIDVARLLTDNPTSAVNCTDRGGRTPFVTAVQYNRSEITANFISKGLYRNNISCSSNTKIKDVAQLNQIEHAELELYSCCLDCSILHIAAQFGQIWFVQKLNNFHISIDWDIKDARGCLPLHAAACFDQKDFISFLTKREMIAGINGTCENGLTPLLKAAKCGSLNAFKLLLKLTQNVSKDTLKLFAFTSVESVLKDNFAKNMEMSAVNVLEILKTVIKMNTDLKIVDRHSRNILHYAIINGQFRVVSHMFRKYPKTSISLMKSADIFKETPLQRAILHIDNTSNTVLIPLLDQEKTIEAYENFLTPVELTVALALNFTRGLIPRTEMFYFLEQLATKNYVSLVTVYIRLIDRYIIRDSMFASKVLLADSTGLITFEVLSLKFELKELVTDISDCIHSCNAILNNCLYHRIAFYVHLSKMYFGDSGFPFQIFFRKDLNSAILSSCYDSEGFNTLERAIQGGNPVLVKHLLEIGVESRRSVTELLHMTLAPSKMKYFILTKAKENGTLLIEFIERNIIHKKFNDIVKTGHRNFQELFFTFFSSGYRDTTFGFKSEHMDSVASIIIKKYNKAIKPELLCVKGARMFSFVHLAALQGMAETLKTVSYYFGDDTVICPNVHSITPAYLAKRHKDVFHFLEQYDVNRIHVCESVERNILFQIYTRFMLKKHGKTIVCIFEYNQVIPRNMYKILKSYICLKRSRKYLGLQKHPTSYYTKVIFNLYSYLNNLKMSTFLCTQRLPKKYFRTEITDIYQNRINVYRRVTQRMDRNLRIILDNFIKGVEEDLSEAWGNLRTILTHWLVLRRNDLVDFPSEFECPEFKRDVMDERKTWGNLRNTYRVNVLDLKVHFVVELSNMAVQLPHFYFTEKNVYREILKECAYFRNNRAFSYMKVIEDLSIFEEAYILYLQTTTEAERRHWLEKGDLISKYVLWSHNAETVKNKFMTL